MGVLQGKSAAITEGNSGIGPNAAARFASEGAFVYIAGRRQDELGKSVKEIEKEVAAVKSNVSTLEDILNVLSKCSEVAADVPTVSTTPPFEKRVSILPPVFVCYVLVTYRSIISARGEYCTVPIFSTFAATKAALRSYSGTTAEFVKRGIRANVISAGPIETPILDRYFTTKEAAYALRAESKASIPLGRIAPPDEVAAVLFVASTDSSSISGIDLPVDGGMASV